MSLNQAPALHTPPEVASSARVIGSARLGEGAHLAQGAVIRSREGAVVLGSGSALLENGVVVGRPELPVEIGQKVVFGHRALVIGASVGDLCEIGNASILLPGVRLGRGCILGEGTLVPEGTIVPDEAVLVGRPGRVIRRASQADRDRIANLRGGDVRLSSFVPRIFAGAALSGAGMGKLYRFRDKLPRVAASAVLFDSAEVTGDVVIGEDCVIGAGVKIIGDSHGPVRIGARVQILENTVLHLLPDNELILEDDVIIGPGAMIHGCHIGAGSVVEPGAIVCDSSRIGKGCLVKAGSLVKQRAVFGDGAILEGFPAEQVGTQPQAPGIPRWAFTRDDLAAFRTSEGRQ